MTTKIEWVQNPDGSRGETWNPIVGCHKISAGCKNCYAERMAGRLKGMGLPQYQDVVDEHGWTGKIGYADEPVWDKPLHWRKPRRVFVCSMSDLFHPDVNWTDQVTVWATMERCPQHTFQVLTKRPEAMRHFVARTSGYASNYGVLPNVWLGVTVERHDYGYCTYVLASTPATVRFVSFEPLLGPIDNYPGVLDGMGWAIIGCESGPHRRPMKLEWAIDLVQQCWEAKIPVFVKQIEINGRVSHDPAEWPVDLRVREYPA